MVGRRAIVIGAGIAGLTAGFRLQEAGYQVTVLEAADHVGGRMASIEKDGYIIDLGASVLTARYRQMRRLAADVGVSDKLIDTNDTIAIWRDGVLHRIRGHSRMDVVRTKALSWKAKLEALRIVRDAGKLSTHLDPSDLSKAAGADSETVRQYADRRVGAEVRDYLIDPIIRAVYQGSMDDLSSIDLFFIMQNFLGGSMMNFREGIDFLARSIAEQLDVRLGARVTSVEESPRSVTVTWEDETEQVAQAEVCVIALTANDMVRIYAQLDDRRRGIIESLTYSTIWNVHIGIDRITDEPTVSIEVPSVEHPDMTAVVLEHNKCPGRTPPGKGLLNSYWLTDWYDKRDHLDDEAVVDETLAGITRVLPGVDQHVEMYHVTRWRPGVLLAGPGTWASLAEFHKLTPRTGRVQFAGDYIGGTTTNSALASGERAARILTGG